MSEPRPAPPMTGIHHFVGMAERADLDVWAWLDEPGVARSGVQDVDTPMPYSTIVFRDPGTVQLELFPMNAP